MSIIEDRLAAKGLSLPPVAAPVAAYIPAVRMGDTIHTSGQLPVKDGALLGTGIVGDTVTAEDAVELARVCALNALAAAAELADSIDDLRVVRLVGYVAATPDFTGHPAVINGASELIVDVLGERGQHARSAVGVASLPLGAPVELELVALVDPR